MSGARRLATLVPLLALAGFVAVLAARRDAEAHAILVQSDPPVNAQLQTSPPLVTAFFSETLDERLSSLEVVDGTGERVDDGSVVFGPEPERMSVGIPELLPPGYYTVIWETLSSVDGHLLKGSYPFTVLNEDGSLPEGPKFEGESGYSGSTAEPDNVFVKWLQLISATMLVGSLAFVLLVALPATRGISEPWQGSWLAASRKRLHWLAWGAAAGLGVSLVGELHLQLDQLGGLDYLDEVLSNDWGERWIQRALVLDAIVIALAVETQMWRSGQARAANGAAWVTLVAGLGYLMLVAMLSHAASVPGSFWATAADFLHLVATAVWVGMLMQFVLFMLWLPREMPEDERTLLHAGHLRRFSAIAATSVVVLLATGTLNALTQVPDVESLFNTAYGRALLVKLSIMCLMLAAAAVNAFYLRPGTDNDIEDGEDIEPLRRRMSVVTRVELAIGVVVIAAAAVLIQYPTSRQVRDAEANAEQGTRAVVGYDEIQPAGDVVINLTISPNTVGTNSYRASLFPGAGDTVGEVLRVRLRFDPPDPELGPSEIEMEALGPSVYSAVGPFFTEAGAWTVHVDVRRAAVDDVSATFPVAVKGTFDSGGRFALPLATGSWVTVIAIVVLVGALLLVTWAGQPRELPSAVPRLVRIGTASAVVISAGVLALSLLPQNEEAQGNPVEPDAQSIALGRQLYTQNCQQCHGESGRGDGPLAAELPVPPADFRLHVPYHEDEFFFNVITNGLGTIMPSFGEQLTEEERWHLVNFLKAEFGTGEQQQDAGAQ